MMMIVDIEEKQCTRGPHKCTQDCEKVLFFWYDETWERETWCAQIIENDGQFPQLIPPDENSHLLFFFFISVAYETPPHTTQGALSILHMPNSFDHALQCFTVHSNRIYIPVGHHFFHTERPQSYGRPIQGERAPHKIIDHLAFCISISCVSLDDTFRFLATSCSFPQ